MQTAQTPSGQNLPDNTHDVQTHREWAIIIDKQSDAIRYVRLAAWVGFAWVVASTILALFLLKKGMQQMMGADTLENEKVFFLTLAMENEKVFFLTLAIVIICIRFLLYSVFSFFAGRAKGWFSIIASALVFLLFLGELFAATGALIYKALFVGVIVIAPLSVLSYVFWAGLVGNWQNRKFTKGLRK